MVRRVISQQTGRSDYNKLQSSCGSEGGSDIHRLGTKSEGTFRQLLQDRVQHTTDCSVGEDGEPEFTRESGKGGRVKLCLSFPKR